MDNGCLKVLIAILIIAVIITCVVVGIGHIEKRKEADKMAEYEMTLKNISITIADKVDGTKNSSYSDGYVAAFKVKFKNNGIHEVQELVGDMKIYNAQGELLINTTCTFTGSITVGEESKFTLNIDHRYSEEVLEFYYADCEDLRVTFQITEATFADGTMIEYCQETPATILELSTNADGISTTELKYREAVSLYERGEYAEAAPLFESLGYYKDSMDYYNQCAAKKGELEQEENLNSIISLVEQGKYAEAIALIEQMRVDGMLNDEESEAYMEEIYLLAEGEAGALAYQGKYAEACELLEPLGCTTGNSQAYRCYYYASQGNFADAVDAGLTVVVFPEGTETIPNNYFKCDSSGNCLEKVVLPSTVKNIGDNAFYNCRRLTEINLPAGLKTIGEFAFYHCKLSEVRLPEGIISIATSTFQECNELTKITLPRGLMIIGKEAFHGTGITEISFPESLQTIGESAFSGCSALRNVTLPASLLNLGDSAFFGCSVLEAVFVPGSVKALGSGAFGDCGRLISVTLGEGVESIGNSAFSGCSMLATVILPNSLQKLQSQAFEECAMLSQIIIPENVTLIGEEAFYHCYALKSVYFANTEGWKKDTYIEIDVTDPQINATKLSADYQGTWTRTIPENEG